MAIEGLGDVVKAAASAVGIHQSTDDDCGCKKRQAALNRMFPLKRDRDRATPTPASASVPQQTVVKGVRTRVGLGGWR